MDDEEKPSPLLLSQTQPPIFSSQANKKAVRNRKAPLWMSDYLVNYNGATEHSSTQTNPSDCLVNYNGASEDSSTKTNPRSKRKADDPSPPTKNKPAVEEDLSCQLCQISCSGIITLRQHLEGRQHKAKLENGKLNTCEVCGIWCTNKDGLDMHFKGQKHKAKINGGESVSKTPIKCELCLVYCMNEDLYEMHLKGKKHATREELKRRGMV